MKKIISCSILSIAVVGIFALGMNVSVANGVWHSVHAGGPDACVAFGADGPGCDANYSLVALQFEDGRVQGQFTDRFGNVGGVHGVVECLFVQGNIAHVSGSITTKTENPLKFYTLVKDNGKNRNTDPADQIAPTFFLHIEFPLDCESIPFVYPWVFDELNDAPEGQVQVR